NSDNSNAGGNSDNSNAGGNSDNSNAGGNSDNSNAGGNSGNSNAGGNSGGATAAPDTKASQGAGIALGISGSQVTRKDNAQEIMVDLHKAKDTGEKISVQGSTITFSKGPVTVTVTTAAELKEMNGVKTAVVRSISMEHQPITAQFKDTGTVSASFRADLMSLPPSDSAITAQVIKNPGPPIRAVFDEAAAKQGYQLDTIAYTMDIEKNNLEDGKDIGPATVTMSVSPSWVADHGDVASVRIARLADDGTSQMLQTRFVRHDNSGNLVFEGTSPGGLSIFALITVKTPPEVIISQSVSQPTVSGSIPFTGEMNSLLFAVPLALLGVFLTVLSREF
ncbi:MAG: hypothetical protein LUQ19_02180, partial [Methanoregula sp.]|nr:hypothetical protein [Methanoregula sp.]